MRRVRIARIWAVLGLVGCAGNSEEPLVPVAIPDVAPTAAHLTRLTAVQYRNSIRDVLSDQLALPSALEPDPPAAGLISVGASETTISAWGVEQYENGAYAIAAQVMDDEALRRDVVPCQPNGTVDATCARAFAEQVGLRLWRRPLTGEELDGLVAIAEQAATTLGDFFDGLEYALAAMLQSPNFLFRNELGEGGRYDGYEMASRLSFFLWNTTPDATLLAAAESGALDTEEGLKAQARRMIDDVRARAGLRSFFSDMFELHELDALTKDPNVFVHYSTEVGAYAREETLLGLEKLIFDEQGDYRDIFTADHTYVNRHLAAIYSVAATSRDGFGRVQLSPESGRRGLLGQASFLALQSHPAASSAVLRGHFVRTVLLCQDIPPPPVNVNTALPEPTETARTLRERNKIHLENPACAGCHGFMDPIGLGLENFDGMGRWRATDNGASIDASGELDGTTFTNAWELSDAIRGHENVGPCLTRTLFRYATSHVEDQSERTLIDALAQRFEAQGFRVKSLLFDIVTSPSFSKSKEAPR